MLEEHRNGLDLVARSLLEHETIDGAEVERLVELGRSGTLAAEVFGERELVHPAPTNGRSGSGPGAKVVAPASSRRRL